MVARDRAGTGACPYVMTDIFLLGVVFFTSPKT